MQLAADVDVETILEQRRAGMLSLRMIGLEHGISPQTVLNICNRHGVKPDLQRKIRAKSRDAVLESALTPEQRQALSADADAREEQIVDANAAVQTDILAAHRNDLTRARQLVKSLMDELGTVSQNQDKLRDLVDILTEPGQRGDKKLREAMQRVLSLTSRAGVVDKLINATKNVIALERETYGIDEGLRREDEMAAAIRELDRQQTWEPPQSSVH